MFGFGRLCKKYYRDLKNLRRFVKELGQTSLDELKAEKISQIDRRQALIDRIKDLETVNQALSERLWQVEKLESIAPQLDKPILYIHGGAGKTGTSSIQHYLMQNRQWLEAHGIYYPFSEALPPLHGNMLALWLDIAHHRATDEQLHVVAATLNYEARTRSAHILFSTEYIAQDLPEHTERFCRIFAPYFHLEFIGFVRDPLNWSFSVYNQRVKYNNQLPPSFSPIDFATFLSASSLPLLIPWRCENIDIWLRYGAKLRFFSFEKHKTNILQTFLGALGLPCDQMPPPSQERANESLSNSALGIMLAFNTVPILANNPGLRTQLLVVLNQSSGPGKAKSRPNPALAAQAYTNQKEMFQKLRPYLAEESVVLDHSSDEPSSGDLKIDQEDAAMALDIITRCLSGRNTSNNGASP